MIVAARPRVLERTSVFQGSEDSDSRTPSSRRGFWNGPGQGGADCSVAAYDITGCRQTADTRVDHQAE
jgi:hypothetical protein